MSKLPFVSVVILCRNESRFIRACLDSWIAQEYPKDRMEIIVADGMSEDGTREIVRQYEEAHSFLRMADNPGITAPCAFNVGIRNGKGDVFVFAGAHASYDAKHLAVCAQYLEEYGADVVGGALDTKPSAETLAARAIALVLSHPFGSGGAGFRTGTSMPVWTDTVFGGCYTRKIIEKTGFFNEDLTGSQDMEYNLRLRKAGGRILLVPGLRTAYYPKGTLRSFFRHNVRDGIWAILPLKIARVPLRPRHYIPLVFVVTLPLSIWPYLAASFFVSLKIARREGDWRLLGILPLVFAVRHIGYGLGSLKGIIMLFAGGPKNTFAV